MVGWYAPVVDEAVTGWKGAGAMVRVGLVAVGRAGGELVVTLT